MTLRLTPAVAKQLAATAGVSIPDPPTRRTRVPHPEIGRGFDTQCRAVGLPVGEPEYRFHPTRRYRSDRAWPPQRILVEFDGGGWLPGGAHSHGKGCGFERDRRKDAEALLLGWRVLRLTPAMVRDGSGVHCLAALLGRPL